MIGSQLASLVVNNSRAIFIEFISENKNKYAIFIILETEVELVIEFCPLGRPIHQVKYQSC